jgi:large subunit ribosomal protein L29
MATKQAAELRALDDVELEHRLTEVKAELFNLRFKHVTGELPNMARLSELRREIARILTLLREREIAEYEAAQDQGIEGRNG